MKRIFRLGLAILTLLALVCCSTRNEPQRAEHANQRVLSTEKDLPLWGGTNGAIAGKTFRTREELLRAVNVWMKQRGNPELTINDLVVRSAVEIASTDHGPLAEQFLEDLTKNRHFVMPVGLWVERNCWIPLNERYSPYRRLELPENDLLSIRLYSAPWRNDDSERNSKRVDTHDIPMAYVLKKKG